MSTTTFRKSLAKYYEKWFRDCHDSAVYCREHNDIEKANVYLSRADWYLQIIINNWEEIEFFSVGDNAFLIDSALPERFRGIA